MSGARQIGRRKGRWKALAFLTAGVPLVAWSQLRINEFMAAPSARLLRVATNGVARLGSGVPWMNPRFVDTNWPTANGSFGFGSGLSFNNDLADQLAGPTLTLYLRRWMNVPPDLAASTGQVRLVIGYESGFIA